MRDFENSAVFGDLEDILAARHRIVGRHRTKFQARLKNLHRIGWPIDFKSIKGKASTYNPGAVVDMALAMELTQLGMSPERVIHVLSANRWATLKAYELAAAALAGHTYKEIHRARPNGGSLSMFVYFDPAGLSSMSVVSEEDQAASDISADTFFYGELEKVIDNLANWTITEATRISLVNITALIEETMWMPFPYDTPQGEAHRQEYLIWLRDWAAVDAKNLARNEEMERRYASKSILHHNIESVEELASAMGLPIERAAEYFRMRLLDGLD